jgi:aspartate/methionine/tyrosine aminotransferase
MNAPVPLPSTFPIRREAEQAPPSGIVEAMTYGRGRSGLIPLWAGEGDMPTPAFIYEAATRSLAAGETFYSWQRGLPELRQALARYHEGLYARGLDPERFSVTVGGMHAAQIAVRMAVGQGDEVLIPTPAWPNFRGAITVAGASPVPVPMNSGPRGWTLDLDRLRDAVTPRTRPSSSTRPQTRPAGRRNSTNCGRFSPSHGGMGCGSSPMRSMPVLSTTRP